MEDAHRDTFKHGNRDWKFTPTRQMFRSAKNAQADNKTPEQRKARVLGLLQKEKEKRDRLKELEIEYTFSGYQGLVDAYKEAHLPTKQPKTEKKGTTKKSKGKSKK